MKKNLMITIAVMLLLLLSMGSGYALPQDPLLLNIDTLQYNKDQTQLTMKASFVNTSDKDVTYVSSVDFDVLNGGQVIASGSVDVSKVKVFTIAVGAAYPWEFILSNPAKGIDLTKCTVESRITYNVGPDKSLKSGKKIYYNGVPVEVDTPPAVIGGRMLIPARAVFEKMNCRVFWNEDSRSVEVIRGNRQVIIAIDSTTMMVDGKPIKLDVAAAIINGRTVVPLRAISTALGANVAYGQLNEMVVIYE